jgi:hypothetical protein
VPQLTLEIRIAFRELGELDQISCTPLETVPGRDQLAILRGFAGELAGAPGVVPRAGFGELCV